MSGFNISDTAKKGWHPKGKDGKSKESWRGDFKGLDQISGWMGKTKGKTDPDAPEHVARPLSSLKDPSSFGPPPKKHSYPGSSADTTATSTRTQGGISSPGDHQKPEEQEEQHKPKSPQPYSRNTTGLSTSHLPPPPVRRDRAADGAPLPKDKPSLPLRLPPRKIEPASHYISPSPPAYRESTSEAPAHRGILNQNSLSRLGAAGVTVPGFDIGQEHPKLTPKKPPPIPPRKSNFSPISQLPSQESQSNTVEPRFVRLKTSPPNDELATSVTTWGEKQPCIKTASSSINNSPSVAFSDGRNTASTLENFRERHVSQVASGQQSAGSSDVGYGLTSKAESYNAPSKITAQEYNRHLASMQGNLVTQAKKPPPPPPKKKPELGVAIDSSGGPPPVPLASKPKPSALPKVNLQIADFDLSLDTQWFAKQHIEFPPPSIDRLPGFRGYNYSQGWTSNGVRKTCTFTGLVTYNTLAYTKIHLTWDDSNPGLTVRAEQRHFPPPKPLLKSELENYRQRYSGRLAQWCELQIGTKVGNGECWTLANNGLAAVASDSTAREQEPCMTSQSYVHGALIYEKIESGTPDPSGGVIEAGVSRGDILQFLNARLEAKNGRSWKRAGTPHHTAVIIGVENGGILRIVEQNIGNVKIVKEGSYDVDELVEGEVRIFRAVGANWVGQLKPTWP